MSLTSEQQLAVESIDKNVLVSAGAGSGKTHVLVERFLEILRHDSKLSVGNIIAVTYTHKAADEMRSRLKERMESLSKSEDNATAKRWQECLAELDGAKIGTIHSLCQSILRSFPEEAIIDPGFSVLDEMEGAELLNESLEEVLYESVAASPDIHDFLTAYPIDAVRKCLDALVKSPITYFEAREKLGTFSEADFSRVFNDIASQVKERVVLDLSSDRRWRQLLSEMAEPFADESNKLEQHRRNIVRLATQVLEDGPLEERFDCLKQIKDIKVYTAGGTSDEAKQMRLLISSLKEINKHYLPTFEESLNEADQQGIACLKALTYLADRVLDTFSKKKLANQKLDFNDQIMLVYKLLGNKASRARQHYNQSIAALLIDEFQDTNAIQAQILESLLGEKARLFLIGDDKQSIYKFQGAEVETFNHWRKRILDKSNSQGLLVELNTSFRSHPQIVAFVNHVFSSLLEPTTIDYRARFQSLNPHRADAAEIPRVEVVGFDGSDEEGSRNNLSVRSVEADAVACWIKEKVQSKAVVYEKATATTRPIVYGDFAVLVQARKDFVFIEQALAAQNVPYITIAGSGLLYAQEVYDLESVLALLWCPEDSHALVTVLRSPLVGLGDDVIQKIVYAAKDELSLWHYLKSASIDECRQAVSMLQSWLNHASAEPVGRLVQTIIADSNYEAILLSLPNGKQRSRNIWKFQQLSFDHNHMPIGEFLQALQSMRELAVRQSAAPLDMGDSVKLMTIHASKGLEFPAVILPVLDGKAISNSPKLIFHRQFGMAFNTARSKSDDVPSLYAAANQMERDMQIAEKKRLLYVAATRARDYLALFVEQEGGDRNSFADWIASVVDVGGAEFEVGSKTKLLAQDTPILVRRIDNEVLSQWQEAVSDDMTSSELVARNTSGASDEEMLEPISVVLTEPTVDWQLLGRITPASDEPSMAPTVLGQFFHLIMQRWQPGWTKVPEGVLNELAHHKDVRAIHAAQRQWLIAEVETLIEKFKNSELNAMWSSSLRTFREMPYVISVTDDVHTRRPDLLLEDKDGQWRIIDFKTDHFEIADINHHLSGHKRQILQYLKDIETLTGMRAKAFVYFAQHGVLREVSL